MRILPVKESHVCSSALDILSLRVESIKCFHGLLIPKFG